MLPCRTASAQLLHHASKDAMVPPAPLALTLRANPLQHSRVASSSQKLGYPQLYRELSLLFRSTLSKVSFTPLSPLHPLCEPQLVHRDGTLPHPLAAVVTAGQRTEIMLLARKKAAEREGWRGLPAGWGSVAEHEICLIQQLPSATRWRPPPHPLQLHAPPVLGGSPQASDQPTISTHQPPGKHRQQNKTN